jgi:tetratricopeptide (TPR) repeat protein
MAAAKVFRRGHVPSADDRRKVATWLDEIFPGQRERDAKGHERLLARGIELIARPLTEPQAQTQSPAIGAALDAALTVRGEGEVARVGRSTLFRRPWFKGVATGIVAALALVGGIAWRMANRDRHAVPETNAPEPVPQTLLATADTGVQPEAALLPDADSSAPVEVAAPVEVPVSQRELRPSERAGHSARRKPVKSAAERLLDASDAAFDGGERIEAIKLAAQAVEAGGGVRADLALARYYRSMHRYREARDHYRAALQLEPGNKLAATGIEVIDKLLAPSP